MASSNLAKFIAWDQGQSRNDQEAVGMCRPMPESASCPKISSVVHEMAESFGRAIDAKDAFTKYHSDEVAVISHLVALAMGLPTAEADVIHIAGHLHDIGKIGVPDAVLQKPGPLTSLQWDRIKEHPRLGAAILKPVLAIVEMNIPALVLCHHERFDGKGYPLGLRSNAIPLGSRIIAVADTLSAMTQGRPYRPAADFDQACAEIEACSGSQFDPKVVAALVSVESKAKEHLLQLKNIETGSYAG